MTLCSAVISKRLHDGPLGRLEGSSLEFILHTVCLAGNFTTASHAGEGLVRRVARSVKETSGLGIALKLLLVPRISHSAGCVMAWVD